jgi:CTP synthase (UTP-ammonia lyase)
MHRRGNRHALWRLHEALDAVHHDTAFDALEAKLDHAVEAEHEAFEKGARAAMEAARNAFETATALDMDRRNDQIEIRTRELLRSMEDLRLEFEADETRLREEEGAVPSAVADDGLIEAVEGDGEAFLVGVQWHPEVFEMADPHSRHLFGGFIRAAMSWSTANKNARVRVGG